MHAGQGATLEAVWQLANQNPPDPVPDPWEVAKQLHGSYPAWDTDSPRGMGAHGGGNEPPRRG